MSTVKTENVTNYFYPQCMGCASLKKKEKFYVCKIKKTQHRIKEGRKPTWCKKEIE